MFKFAQEKKKCWNFYKVNQSLKHFKRKLNISRKKAWQIICLQFPFKSPHWIKRKSEYNGFFLLKVDINKDCFSVINKKKQIFQEGTQVNNSHSLF